MKIMKIGFFSQYAEKHLTGMNKVFLGCTESLCSLYPDNDYYLIGESEWLGIDLPVKQVIVNSAGITNLNWIQNENSFDVIHSHYRAFHCAQKYKCRKIITVHDIMPYTYPQWFSGSVAEWIAGPLADCMKESDTIIARSYYTKSEIVRCFDIDEKKIKVIYPGIYPEDKFVAEGKKPESININRNNYLFAVSAMQTNKNQDGLVKAFCAFMERHTDMEIKLVFAGPRRNATAVEKEISRYPRWRDRIIFTGYVTDDELVWLYKNALVIPYVSFAEGFGLPVLEGLKAGRAVITSDTASMPEVGGSAVEYCNPFDTESIVLALEKVIFDSEYRKHLENGANTQAAKFSYSRMAKELMMEYREI